ncbi:phosphomevalonate kinase [Staphylococcus aureus]|uniref:phosphomevalonate kinase n=1 Tax=Staphylococcus aureus TaxID=1280 RepID=UPI0009125DC8|nr:phosphomevalonate kinase [Staphylococcus aureus]SGR55875.1 Phosphomevalonate kinase [Staphylococcus aureus]SGT00102.1 Phosphomevalonate kinase [Staphylococcus aureus]SGT01885.1 Phosphomevalonate kinase [Staphylococcus aureus]SGT18010.1 Phosphomevalonate kinase [Staphylococcus aureus]SGT56711.1 Phosphomevalonate kinase [Staphylococcus aureus]
MIQVKAPGKLYIAGEYAVTEPGYKSVLIALDRFVTATIEEADQYKGTIHSKALHHNPVTFSRDEDSIVISDSHAAKQLNYVVTAIEIFEQYAKSCDIAMKHFHLTIDSNLDDSNGHKYGLGSSAAVLVSVIKVLNEFYDMKLSNLYIYKLAVIANMKLQSLSSCGDIAVSVYSGWLAYSTFDHEWVKHQIEDTTVEEVLIKNWPGLHIEPLQAPENMEVLIGWTGSPASSPHFVSEVKRLKSDPSFYGDFLEDSHRCVEKLIHAFKTNNIKGVQKMVRQNRTIIQRMDKEATVDIETEKLKYLCDTAEKYHGASKTSGAGGGDCGITIINKDVDKEKIYDEWTKHGIKPLKFNIYHGQ